MELQLWWGASKVLIDLMFEPQSLLYQGHDAYCGLAEGLAHNKVKLTFLF